MLPRTTTGSSVRPVSAIRSAFTSRKPRVAVIEGVRGSGTTRMLIHTAHLADATDKTVQLAHGLCVEGRDGENAPFARLLLDRFGITPASAEQTARARVMTEVSELSNDNAITLNQQGSSLTIPAIRTRRAETTLEIPSGGAMAMAGLIAEQTKQAINGLPGLTQLPILGSLFRSRDFVTSQTELVVLVTPYVVRAVAQKDLSRPDDGFASTNDPQADLLGSINRIYGAPGRVEPARNYRGTYGFITD